MWSVLPVVSKSHCYSLLFIGSDISNCEVVTAWAAGCTWTEALRISGSPPGDLARTLSRVLDAVRQLGNLPFRPVRKQDLFGSVETATVSRGLDPAVRRLCREASHALNRYPVKDPLAFETAEDEVEDHEGEEEQEDEDIDYDGGTVAAGSVST